MRSVWRTDPAKSSELKAPQINRGVLILPLPLFAITSRRLDRSFNCSGGSRLPLVAHPSLRTAKIVLAMRRANAMATTFIFFRASMSDSQLCFGPHLDLTMICDMAPK